MLTNKKISYKILSLIVCLALIVGTLSLNFALPVNSAETAATFDSGLIEDGGFENGGEGFALGNSDYISSDFAYEGEKGFGFTQTSGEGSTYIKNIYNLKKEQTYILSFMVFVSNDTEYVKIGYRDGENNSTYIDDDGDKVGDKWFTENGTWTQHTVTFTPTKDQKLTLWLWVKNGKGGIDNLKLEKEKFSGDLLTGSDFEGGEKNFKYNEGNVLSVAKGEGEKAYGKAGTGDGTTFGITTKFELNPNSRYSLSFWIAKNTSKQTTCNLYYNNAWAGGGTDYAEGKGDVIVDLAKDDERISPATSLKWKKITVDFTTDDSHAGQGLTLEITSGNSNKLNKVYIDDISLSELVFDGGFEHGGTLTGLDEEKISTNIKPEYAKDGNYGLGFTGGTSEWSSFELNPDIKLEVGKKYLISCDLRLMNEKHKKGETDQPSKYKGGFKITDRESKAQLLGATSIMTITEDENDWRYKYGLFTAESEYCNIYFYSGIEGTLSIDNLKIEEYTGQTLGLKGHTYDNSLITNGDFDGADAGNMTPSGGDIEKEYAFDEGGYGIGMLSDGEWAGISLTPMDQSMFTPGQQYTIAFRVSLTGSVDGDIYIKDADGTLTSAKIKPNDGMWDRKTYTFTAGETAIAFYFYPKTGGMMMLDEIGLWKSEDAPTFPKTDVVTSFYPTQQIANSPENNLISDAGFESTGNWDVSEFVDGETLKVVEDADKARNGSKYLSFDNSGKKNRAKLVVDVEPNTEYCFSVWVNAPYLADDNAGKITFGIADADSGQYFTGPWTGNANDYTAKRQLMPPSYDNSWHLRSINFNSDLHTKVMISIEGENSKACFDDITFCKLENAVRYMNPLRFDVINTKSYSGKRGCTVEDNAVKNFNFQDKDISFWSSVNGYGNFVTVDNADIGYGVSLKYKASEQAAGLSYIRWLDVKPNTDYVFTANMFVMYAGEGYMALVDGSTYIPKNFVQVTFDDDSSWEWQNLTFAFNTGAYSRIGFLVCDKGGEAYMDNIRVFEKSKATDIIGNDGFDPSKVPKKPTDVVVTDDETTSETKIIKKGGKRVIVRRKLKDDGFNVWPWVIGGGGALFVAAATTFTIIFIKKKKQIKLG